MRTFHILRRTLVALTALAEALAALAIALALATKPAPPSILASFPPIKTSPASSHGRPHCLLPPVVLVAR